MEYENIIAYKMPKKYKTWYQDISFTLRIWRLQPTEDTDKEQQEIGKKPDPMNPENLPEYIWPFTHLFNKKKFKKLLEWREWDHKVNLIEDAPRELNAKAYVMN